MAQLLAAPYSELADANGAPLAGGKVYTYAAGTTTPQATYTDQSGVTPASNPVILDSAGRATVWMSGSYKIVVKDANDVTIRTTDNVIASGASGDMTKAVYDPANIQEQLLGLTAVQTVTNKTIAVTNNTFNFTPITAALGADVDLNNTGNYFDGPSIAQGSTGTWWVTGQVTVLDTAGGAGFNAKLWDGTTVIASGSCTTNGGSHRFVIHLAGYLAAPAGNLRISVKDTSATTGKIKYNDSGNSKDSVISAMRIA